MWYASEYNLSSSASSLQESAEWYASQYNLSSSASSLAELTLSSYNSSSLSLPLSLQSEIETQIRARLNSSTSLATIGEGYTLEARKSAEEFLDVHPELQPEALAHASIGMAERSETSSERVQQRSDLLTMGSLVPIGLIALGIAVIAGRKRRAAKPAGQTQRAEVLV